MGTGLMASSWGNSWLKTWGNSWGVIDDGEDLGPHSVSIGQSVHGGFKSVTWAPIIKKVGGKGTSLG